MSPSTRVPVTTPGIICRLTDDGAVLVSPEAGDLRVLNRVGAAIWQLIDGTRDVAALEAELAHRYGIPAAQAHTDLDEFLADLQRRGLLTWQEPDVG
ncbi:MAG: PqqD family protein [Anaerolineae bacterium]|nr:PqqD family protein [Anaerolineae bacterium]